MNNNIFIVLIPLLIANAQASGTCTNEKRKINDQNTFILTGTTPFGPVKSIQSITIDENNNKTTGNISAEFSDCGELISLERSYEPGSNTDIYSSSEKTKLIKNTPPHTQTVFIYNYPQTYTKSIVDNLYYVDKEGKIIKQKTQSADEKQEKLKSNEIINTSTSAEGVYNWNHGLVDNMTSKSSDNLITTIQYHWNDNGKISNTIVNSIEGPAEIWLTKLIYYYSAEQFFEKKVNEFYKNDKMLSSATVACLENDPYGNCILETTTFVIEPNQKPSLISTTKYNYQYY